MAKTSYAVVEIAGKQYKVSPGDKINVDFLDAVPDKKIDLDKVMLIADGEETLFGKPLVENAMVKATCLAEGKDDKIIVFKYKSKVRYRRKKGHRQLFTKLEINNIVKPDGTKLSSTHKEKVKAGGKS
jgi:large subunit ribosomal protein L21